MNANRNIIRIGRTAVGLYILSELTGSAATRHVWPESPNPSPPYGTWGTAARTIQDAVDAAPPSDEILVTNGVYATGGQAVGTNVLVNRVAVDKPLTLRSVNGPAVTIIQGYQVPGTTNGDGAIRCGSQRALPNVETAAQRKHENCLEGVHESNRDENAPRKAQPGSASE